MSRWNTLRACRKRYVALLGFCAVVSVCGRNDHVDAAPAWSPPQFSNTGDVDEAYYSALTVVQPGTSDNATRDQAIAALPLSALSSPAQAKARQVVSSLSLYRRLPTLRFAADRRAYGYFLMHPDVAVSTWRAMEISKFELKQTAAGVYHADAQDGSIGLVEVWKSSPEETLIYCDGAFKSPLLAKPIVARAVMHLRTRFVTDAEGQPLAEHTGDVLVSFPSVTVETIARMISPVSHVIADRNFKQLSLYIHLMSLAMSRQPAWVESIARRMDAPEEQRREMLKVTAAVRSDAEQRAQATMLNPLPMELILTAPRPSLATPVTPASAQVPATTRR